MNAQQLKNSILQEAIEGRLVPQDPNDEPASVLLDKIRKEKARLVKEGKLKKKDLIETPISEEEIPFKIPESWEWCKLGNISEIARGGSPRPIKEYLTEDPNGLNWIKIGDTDKGGKYINSCKEKIKPEGLKKTRMVHPGDFLLTNSMSFGRPYITNIEGCIHDGWLMISPYAGFFDQSYLYYVLSSAFSYKQFSNKVAGAVVQNLNSDKVADLIVPLPPLAEQKRIVAKIEELMPKVEKYGKAQEALDKLNEELPDKLKKSVLQEAIEGRLVPQDPNDEPASVLLDKIRKEKARLVKEGKLKKKDLVETPISEDEKPFEIPESWEWHRISTIANLYTGNSISKEVKESKYTNVKGRWYIATKDVNFDSTIDYDNGIYIPEKDESQFKIALSGSVLMCIEGGSAGRKIGIIDKDVCFGNKLCCFNSYGISNEYLYYYLQSSNFKQIFNDNKKGIIGGVSINLMAPLLIPIPPLAEQHRIVAKIEQLMKEIDKLKE